MHLDRVADASAAGALLLLLAIACVTDVRRRRIPNSLVVIVFVAGILVTTALDPYLPGFIRAVGGAALGLSIWLPGWLLRMMGAGDVKLFSAAGAWLGPWGILNAAIIAALVGGVMALLWLVVVRGGIPTKNILWVGVVAPRTLVDARSDPARRRELVPYSLAITFGVAVQLVFPGLVLG